MADRQRGTCKWFNNKKGYGFIQPEDGSNDVFVHYSGIKGGDNEFRVIYEGDIVEYEVIDGKKGPQASEVVIVEEGPRKKCNRRGSYY